jgi:hypothetical protein
MRWHLRPGNRTPGSHTTRLHFVLGLAGRRRRGRPAATGRLRRPARALSQRGRHPDVRRPRPRDRAQWQQALGALAFTLPHVPAQTFVEWAAQSIPHSYWARAFDEQQRAKGSAHQAALRALAFKWIRILYRCWQDRTPYDEATDLTALKRRGSPRLGAGQKSSNSA